MKEKSLLTLELSLGAVVGIIAVAIFKRIFTPTKTSPGGSRDKPIIVSGGSLHLSSRATFSTVAGVFQVSFPSCLAKSVYISVGGADPVCYTPTLPWSITLNGGGSGNLTLASSNGATITLDNPASAFYDVFTDTFSGSMKKHNTIMSVNTISSTNLGIPSPINIPANDYYIYIDYSS